MATKQAQPRQLGEPLVHHMVRTISAGPIAGSISGAQADVEISDWIEKGYSLDHVDSHIEQHEVGAEKHYAFVTLYILTKNGAG